MLRCAVVLAAVLPVAAMAIGEGDPQAGQEKASVCAACHGMDGNSQVPEWPKLAGQHAEYTARQTRMVRDGQREVVQMAGIVAGLTDQDIADIAAWYAQQTVKPGVADETLADLGRSVYQAGNAESGVPACMACHGPVGNGLPGAHYPKLRGQHAAYTADRLRRYRGGETNGGDDPHSQVMAAVAAGLTDEEIEAVASYIEGLHRAE